MEDAIINTGDAKYICAFVREVKYANIEKLEDQIIYIGDPYYIYNFACKVKGANIKKLEDAIIATGNVDFIRKFSGSVIGSNTKKLYEALSEIERPQQLEKSFDVMSKKEKITFLQSVMGDIESLMSEVQQVDSDNNVILQQQENEENPKTK